MDGGWWWCCRLYQLVRRGRGGQWGTVAAQTVEVWLMRVGLPFIDDDDVVVVVVVVAAVGWHYL